MRKSIFHAIVLLFFFIANLAGQNEAIVLEAEDALLGADYEIIEEADLTYVLLLSNSAMNNPESGNRVITFEVDFPAAQKYDLYIRLRVGNGTIEDDSFFYGNGFGEKDPTDNDAWIRVNNIVNTGYTADTSIVDGAGAASSGIWKWINVSEYMGDEAPVIFDVPTNQLSQVFQIGGREDGLDIDKIAFGRSDLIFTVSNLDNGEEGRENVVVFPPNNAIARNSFKFLGNVYSNSQLPNFTEYWNQVTPENAGKWGSVEGTRDVMNWTALDAAYALAKDNGFPFKLHVLIWGNQQPSWIESLPPSEQLEEIKEWFAALAERYPDMDYIEVVNEPISDPPNSAGSGGGNYINALGGIGSTGYDWILEAFRLARSYFPNSELMINEYNIINNASRVNTYLNIINLLKAENLIDQIGIQAHAFSLGGSEATMMSNLNTLAGSGLPIYVTEMDIDGPTDAIQLDGYQRIFPIFWEHPAVKGVTLWGYRPGMWRTEQKAYLIEDDGVTERPALVWLREYVEGTILSTKDQEMNPLIVFPNPVNNGLIQIKGVQKIHSAALFDVSGRLVDIPFINNSTLSLSGKLPSGMYLLSIIADNKQYTQKIFINM